MTAPAPLRRGFFLPRRTRLTVSLKPRTVWGMTKELCKDRAYMQSVTLPDILPMTEREKRFYYASPLTSYERFYDGEFKISLRLDHFGGMYSMSGGKPSYFHILRVEHALYGAILLEVWTREDGSRDLTCGHVFDLLPKHPISPTRRSYDAREAVESAKARLLDPARRTVTPGLVAYVRNTPLLLLERHEWAARRRMCQESRQRRMGSAQAMT